MTRRAYRRPPEVGVVEGRQEESPEGVPVYLARLPQGPLVVLEGSAAVIWRAATREGAPSEVVRTVAEELGTAQEDIRADVESFLEELVREGLLEPATGPTSN